MESIAVAYPVFSNVYPLAKVYYVPNVSDDGYSLYCASDELFITCNIDASDSISIIDFVTNHQIASILVTCRDDAYLLGKITNDLTLVAPRTTDGRIRIAAEKSSLSKSTIYSPNYCDETTWYPAAVYVVNESISQSGDGYYHLAHTNIIDSYHGKISDEDNLLGMDGYSLRVTVIQDGYIMTEQDPHFATGGDYTINYTAGIIYPITLTSSLFVTYHYANGSTFSITPPTGMAIIIDSAECEFSTDIILTDTVEFIVMGYASVFAPQLGLPAGYRIPLSTTKYKTMNDYYNDAVKSYPVYPPMGGSGWRGVNAPSTVLNWDYISATAISSMYGMQVVIKLEHDTAFGGLYATTTFFTIIEPDPNL